MKMYLKSTTIEKEKNTCLMIGVYEDQTLTESAKKLDKHTKGQISKLLKDGVFTGKFGCTQSLLNADAHVILVGCGKKEPLTVNAFLKLVTFATKAALAIHAKKATCYLTDLTVKDQSVNDLIKHITLSAHDALYRFDLFRSIVEPAFTLAELTIHVNDAKAVKAGEKAIEAGLSIAQGVFLAKNLGNTPSNICTPTFLAEQAKELAKTHKGISVDVLGEAEMRKLKMGAILGVSQGSNEEAKLICLEYKGGKKGDKPIAFVGKGVTFDTGGNSLKTPDNMVGMKYDMCGAATVLGVFKAAASMKLPLNIVGVLAAVENMPGGTAYKPEDILVSMSGQTIEVISTDAEGRLALCDALTYTERYEPKAVIDIATLTGAVVIALGSHATGLMSNNDKLANDLLQAGSESGDRAWQLPLWDDYQEQIKSPYADISNTGGRSAGTITAGCFLSRFTKKFNWAHLDVAGTAAMMMGSPSDRYATGRPIPMLMQYLINQTL